jgi:hypothetical protein
MFTATKPVVGSRRTKSARPSPSKSCAVEFLVEKAALGHRHLGTTEAYARLGDADVRRAITS